MFLRSFPKFIVAYQMIIRRMNNRTPTSVAIFISVGRRSILENRTVLRPRHSAKKQNVGQRAPARVARLIFYLLHESNNTTSKHDYLVFHNIILL